MARTKRCISCVVCIPFRVPVAPNLADYGTEIKFRYCKQKFAFCLLQRLFMSADSAKTHGSPNSEQSVQPSERSNEASRVEPRPVLEEEDWSEGRGRDCVICQNAAVNRVLLPCRHACVCDSCMSHFQHCPICRAYVLESFTLAQGPVVAH